MGKVIAITSGKGGTGKTMFTSNMGVLLAERGYKVLLIDMDMGLRNLDLVMGMESRVVYDIADVLLGVCKTRQAIIKDRRVEGLFMMPAPQLKKEEEIDPKKMLELCEELREKYDYVLIDVPAGIDQSFELAAIAADSAVIVTTPEFTAIRDADAVDRSLIELGISDRAYVLNRVRVDLIAAGVVPSVSDISNMMRIDMIGIIQEDENIYIATTRGIPIVQKKGTYIRENFEQILDRII